MIDAELFPYEGDLLVANAARGTYGIAYDTWSDTPRTPRGRSDSELVSDLGADAHRLPFRHAHMTLRCQAPIPVARQLGKHQVGFSWSEISRRYKDKGLEFHMVEQWRHDPATRQGTGEDVPAKVNEQLKAIQARNIAACMRDFREARALGASMEQARFLLPQSMQALWVWTGSLLAWADMIHKRSHPDTQKETRGFVEKVDLLLTEKFPHGWQALKQNAWR